MAAPQQISDGLCLRFSGDIQNQPALSIEMAVNLLIRGTQASLQLPFAWGYIDRPAGTSFSRSLCIGVALNARPPARRRWRCISCLHCFAYGISQ